MAEKEKASRRLEKEEMSGRDRSMEIRCETAIQQ